MDPKENVSFQKLQTTDCFLQLLLLFVKKIILPTKLFSDQQSVACLLTDFYTVMNIKLFVLREKEREKTRKQNDFK